MSLARGELVRLLSAVCLTMFGFAVSSNSAIAQPRLLFSSAESNDLYQAAIANFGSRVSLFRSPQEAIEAANVGDILLVTADKYPDKPTPLRSVDLNAIRAKKLRSYVELPRLLTGEQDFETVEAPVERVVVVGEALGKLLPSMSLLQANGLRYVPVDPMISRDLGDPILVAARVGGFDSAIYGLPAETFPLLFASDSGDTFIATTSLSRFRKGRYSPYSSWKTLWNSLLQQLLRQSPPVSLKFPSAVVTASYEVDDELPSGCQRQSVERGIEWFGKANMVIHPEWKDRVAGPEGRVPPLPYGLPMGDGSLGSMEAVLSIIQADGHQVVSSVQRGDCICETAMAYALSSKVLDDPSHAKIASNLLDYYLLESSATKNERGDPEHGAYGLSAWGITNPDWYVANYGDDNARVILSTMTAAGVLGEDRWNETIARCVIGNLRTTGRLGFRGDRIDIGPLGANGWQHYFKQSPISYAPHFESYLWACYLWAYSQTGDPLLLDRAKTALEMTMKQYPSGLRWTNGLAQERARILLPLAWLVRVDDTPENRAMLQKGIDGLLSIQDSSGAIREELGSPGRGVFPPPQSNEAYGTSEASLIASNGDPVADLLYTNNFALVGLHEAAAVTDDPRVRKAEDRLVDFLIRIQAKSDAVPEVDGGWMRAFDFERWEPWGSNADLGWGAWSIESGWTQGWVTTVLAAREIDTSLWDLMSDTTIGRDYPSIRQEMLPQKFVDEVESDD